MKFKNRILSWSTIVLLGIAALCYGAASDYKVTNDGTVYSYKSITQDLITKGPWVDVRSFMDGQSGRPTYATWFANQETTDLSTVWTALIASLPAGGGKIKLPYGIFVINASAIAPGSKPLVIEGVGHKSLVNDVFGNAQWIAAGAILGSVIKVTGTTNGITLNDATYRKLVLRDLAILGPGSGTSYGVYAGAGAQNNELIFQDVMIANFSKGLYLYNSLDNSFYNLRVWGCQTGIQLKTTTDMRFYDLNAQTNGAAVLLEGASGIKFYGGLCQNNTVGFSLTPAAGEGVTNIHLDGLWFEGNTTPLVINTTNSTIGDISLRGIRSGDTFTLTPTIVSTLARLSMENCQIGGWTLDFAGTGIRDVYLRNISCAALNMPTSNQEITRINVNDISSFASPIYAMTYAATVTPDYANGEVQKITITGNVDFDYPINAPTGATVTFIIRQDGVGGYTVTWGAVSGGYMAKSWSDAGNTTWKYSSISFRHIGSNQWIQMGAQLPYS